MPAATVRILTRFGLPLTLFFLLAAHPAVAIECHECHGTISPPDLRPLDDSGRNILTGGFKASHRKHMDAGATKSSCTPCHPGSQDYGPGHRNGQITIGFASPVTAAYRNGSTSFPQRPEPRLGSCANISCHSDGTSVATGTVISRTTPVWGSSGQSCSACHGFPPAYSNGSPKANAHGSHAYACSYCHHETTNDGSALSNKSIHGNGAYNISNPEGSTYFTYAYASNGGTCSNIVCHLDGTELVTENYIYRSATWSSTGQCIACHGNPPSYASGAPKTNSHLKHSFSCNRCHYLTTSNGTTVTTPSNHRNGWYNVSGPANEYLYYNGAACSNSYCHGNGTNVATGAAANSNSSPAWGNSTPLPCTSCHAYPPAYARGTPKSNTHLLHNSYSYKCSQCHYATTQNGTTIAAGSTVHANHAYDISGPPDRPVSYTYASSGGTCVNSYCHSSGQGVTNPADPPTYTTSNWNQRSTVRCGKCHKYGYHAYDYARMNSGSHYKHMLHDYLDACKMCHYTPKYGSGGHCGECHNPGTTSFSPKVYTDFSPRGAEHANGVIDVAFLPTFPIAGATGSYSGDSIPGTPYGSCTNLYCHSQGTRVTPPYAPGNIPTVMWGGGPMPADCTGCHGGDANSAIPIATLSHSRHIAYDCAKCHQFTAYNSRNSIPSRPISGYYYSTGSYHSNGAVEVSFLNTSTAVSGTYAGQSTTIGRRPGTAPARCVSVYCHSNGTTVTTRATYGNISTPIWGTSGRLGCGSCHGNPPAYADGAPKANGHTKHSTDCSLCHYSVTTNGTAITDKTKHAQYIYDLKAAPGENFVYTYSATGSSCSNVSCHTNGTYPRTWGATSCGNCHIAPPTDNSHKKHFYGAARYAAYGNISANLNYGYNCGLCHPQNPARDNDGTNQVEFYNAAAPAGTLKGLNSPMSRYSSGSTTLMDSRWVSYTNGSCRDIYCHSNGTSAGTSRPPVSARIVWNSGSVGCNSCHNTVPDYPNGSPKANSHSKHYQQSAQCWDCHNNVTSSSYTITDKSKHLNGRYDLAPSSGKSFTFTYNAGGSSSCSSVSCHNDGTKVATGTLRYRTTTFQWGGPSLGCTGCHAYPPDYANNSPKRNSHAKHAEYGYGCQECHSSTTYNGTYTSSTYHRNGQYNVNGPRIGGFFYYQNLPTCNMVYCHSNGTSVATGTISVYTPNAVWGDITSCGFSCHSYPPSYQDRSPKGNAHGSHTSYGCQICHATVTTDGTTISDRTKHVNVKYDIVSNGSAFFNYSSSAGLGSCSNISCHAPGRQNVNWRYAPFPYVLQPAYGTPAPVTTAVSIQFSVDMDPATINSSTFLLDNGVTGTVSYDQATRSAVFTPSQPLDYNNVFTVTTTTGMRTVLGEMFPYEGYLFQFTTEKGPQFSAIRSETFDSGGTPAFTWFTPSCNPAGACWTLQSQSTPFTAEGNNGPYASLYAPNTGTDAMLVSSPIDLSGYQSAELSMHFQQGSYSVWNGYYNNNYWATVDLEVSANGTAGPWTKVMFASNNYPYLTSVNISSYVKGKSNVAIRFRYYNTPAGPTAGYFDNITISGDPL